MKAITLRAFGDIDQFELIETAVPQLASGEVLVKVKTIGLNPVDYKTRQGKAMAKKLKQPYILGWDVSGVVEKAATDSKFKVGDEVFGMVNFPGSGNAYAEYVAAPESHLVIKPQNISFEEAAAAPLAALTVYQTIVKYANIKTGDRVLIHAGAGGVGHLAIQIAKSFGAYVIATASAKNKEFLEQLGTDEFIDYNAVNFETAVKDIDVVLDGVGGEVAEKSLKVLKKGGFLHSIPSAAKDLTAIRDDVEAPWILVESNGEDMEQVAKYLAEGAVKVHIQQVYNLEQIGKAHKQLESRRTRGKLVVKID
ncbi:NADP-dependent oxidoreductase [Chondrinema litorale]|uniref:NADP-dependent oxidoreductase n=1 Tax=Chondrinema litorale TaxID=2994555 RepID=UPI002543DC69|nr:NADP-dependent oxidoreductase [Chondrinema litorale]UZR97796.1 NADP-dependent oxidoreductase [Chondrinema litorale]